jgi:flagellar L-ring protein precursor FlgH
MKKQNEKSFFLAAPAALLLLVGCASTHSIHLPAPERENKVVLPRPAPPLEGSLWSPHINSNYYADLKARNVGDIVTINIVESASASKNAETKTARTSGLEASWSGVLSKLVGGWVGDEQKVSFGNEFDGKGETTRSSRLNAYITAQVVQVLPNGNLVIQGTREVQVNQEKQFIFVQGIIRPEDISSSNIILSTSIAEARIELSGQGAVSDKQRPGWFARILDWVWPF